MRQLLRVTLIKDLRERLQHIGDSRLFLARGVFPEITAETRDDRRSHRVWIAVAISSAMLLAALAAGSWYLRREPPAAPAMRFEIPAPGFIPQPAGLGVLSISPDGQHIAYVASVEGGTRIMLRPVAQAVARGLPGTENATGLFWSPSNRDLGFTASGKLKKIDITSGTVRDLADASAIAGGTWNADDVILFGAGPGRASFLRVTASGGSVSSIPIDDAPRSAVSLYQPIFLPDGRHILYHALTPMDRAFVATVYARVVDSGPAKQITDLGDPSMTTGSSPAIFATPSYLMFTKSGTLFVQRIDVDRLEAVADPVPIAENVGTYAVSNTGVLVYAGPPPTSQPGTSIPSSFTLRRQLTWVSRSGAFERTIGDPSTYGNPRLSPDGRRIAVQRIESGTGDIWSIDDTSGLASRQTFDPSEEGVPIWSPQGDRLLFTSSRGTLLPFPNSLYERAANGAGGERLILQGEVGELLIPQDWSVDGLVAFERVPSARLLDGGDLWVMPLMGDKKPFPLVQVARGRARAARFSPDGRWVSYSIDESGTSRIVVRPFPDVKKGIWQVPGTSGTEAIWRRDGRELFYLTPDRTMMAVPVTLGESPRFDQPVKLFTTNLPPQTNPAQFVYDVSADGQHFLLNLLADDPAKARPPATPVPPSPATQLTVIINWTSLLKK